MLAGGDATDGAHRVLVDELAAHAVDLDDPCALHALAEVLVGREDPHLLDLRREARRRGGEGVIGLPAVHRPHDDAERPHRDLGEVELRTDRGRHAFVRLVAVEQLVPERDDRVVEGDREVRDRLVRIVEERQHRRDEAGRRLHVHRPAGELTVFGGRWEKWARKSS